ncbi:MAG: hypothetical protein H0Z38_03865 [Firmicutes bacterium]|nr:hypothetical protein [Bacillota bacterium]
MTAEGHRHSDADIPHSDIQEEAQEPEADKEAEAREALLAEHLDRLVDEIRRKSQQGELTKLSEVDLGEDLEEEEQEELKKRLLEVEEIKSLTGGSGTVYLYSEAQMVERYARTVMAREENDPKQLVADTVREESKLYPRPTAIKIFTLPPFRIPPEILETIVEELVADEDEYADIQLSVASNDARYLYSTRYMQKQHADSLTEWYEVGQYESQ